MADISLEDRLWNTLDKLATHEAANKHANDLDAEKFIGKYNRSTEVSKSDFYGEFTKASKVALELAGYKFPHDEMYVSHMENLFSHKKRDYAELKEAFLKPGRPDKVKIASILKDALSEDAYQAEVGSALRDLANQPESVKTSVYQKLAKELGSNTSSTIVAENPQQAFNDLFTMREIARKYQP